MMFNLTSLVNWKELSIKKQRDIDKSNLRENRRRIDYDYEVGQKIYIKNDGINRKLDCPKQGPFEITEV